MTVDNVRIARAIEGLEKSVTLMAKSIQSIELAISKIHHPAFQGRSEDAVNVILNDVSTTFTFEHPEIQGRTQIYQQTDGFLRVVTEIDPSDSERFLDLLDVVNVHELIVEAVDTNDDRN